LLFASTLWISLDPQERIIKDNYQSGYIFYILIV